MDKKKISVLIGLSIASAVVVTTFLTSGNHSLSFLGARNVSAEVGPSDSIDSVSFFKNDAVKAAYGGTVGTGAYADYQVNRTFSMSGGDWVVSAAAYGEDSVVHLEDAGRHETLFFSSIWDTNIRDSYSVYSTTLENGTFGSYKDDFEKILTQYPYTVFSMILMSTTQYTNVKDLGFFFHYAAHNADANRPAIGVIPLYKIDGETTWNRIYSDGLSWANGRIVYSDATVVDGNATISTDDMIDYSPYTRYYDGAYLFNQTPYVGIPSDKPVQIAFFVFGDWTNYYIDTQLDGIIINRHESAMKFMNGLNSKTICDGGTIADANIKKSFELFDRAFESASQTQGVNDLNLLENYSINANYPNLKEANYYAQYQYLKAHLA